MTDLPPPEYALLLDAIEPCASAPSMVPRWDGERWQHTLSLAEWHRLAPILYRHLRSEHDVWAPVQTALEDAYFTNAARNLFIGEALRRVLDALAIAAVPAMLLKGAALLESVYDDPALRQMRDLDILVPAGRLDDANHALEAIGYRRAPATMDDRSDTQAWMRVNHHHDPPLVGEEGLTAVELHHHIATLRERGHFDIAGMWERARPAATGPTHLLPSAEDLLLHVCLHFTRLRAPGSYQSGGSGGALGQVCDIAWIVDREQIDWDAFAATAREYRLAPTIFLALFVAHELGIAVPREALHAMCPRGYDPSLGRRLIRLRVLRSGPSFPVRSLSWMLAPGRDVLAMGWDADPKVAGSLARAYVRRAKAQIPLARRPLAVVQDYRLGRQIESLERRGGSPS